MAFPCRFPEELDNAVTNLAHRLGVSKNALMIDAASRLVERHESDLTSNTLDEHEPVDALDEIEAGFGAPLLD